MIRERVTEDVFVFISSLYAEVGATVIVSPEGAVVIDTLPFPEETQQIREFARRRSSRAKATASRYTASPCLFRAEPNRVTLRRRLYWVNTLNA